MTRATTATRPTYSAAARPEPPPRALIAHRSPPDLTRQLDHQHSEHEQQHRGDHHHSDDELDLRRGAGRALARVLAP